MRKKTFMKILIVGDETYKNKNKVFTELYTIYAQKVDLQLYLATFNKQYGAEEFVKEFAISNNMRFGTFKRFNEQWDELCVLPMKFYCKPYSPKLFHIRNAKAIDWCDMLVIFTNTVELDKNILALEALANKKDKPVFVYDS